MRLSFDASAMKHSMFLGQNNVLPLDRVQPRVLLPLLLPEFPERGSRLHLDSVNGWRRKLTEAIAPPTETSPATRPAMIAPVIIPAINCSIESSYRFTNLKYIRSPNMNENTEPA